MSLLQLLPHYCEKFANREINFICSLLSLNFLITIQCQYINSHKRITSQNESSHSWGQSRTRIYICEWIFDDLRSDVTRHQKRHTSFDHTSLLLLIYSTSVSARKTHNLFLNEPCEFTLLHAQLFMWELQHWIIPSRFTIEKLHPPYIVNEIENIYNKNAIHSIDSL